MRKLLLMVWIVLHMNQSRAQGLYFPPLTGAQWDTVSPTSLNWCVNYMDTLYDYLQQQNTRAFIVLKDGKLVMEKYFGNHSRDSFWYWASAGKTLTSFLVGKAQEENKLQLSDTTSTYLGAGWTSLSLAQEQKITIQHQLSMTTGLDDGVPDVDCTADTCLTYLADAGTRWAYHNAPYTLLENVVEIATATDYNVYTNQKLKSKTGMNGFWLRTGPYNNVYYSNARSMARFGLLMLNKGKWNSTPVLSDSNYFHQMVNTSQNENLSYGYLWWLNGKSSYMVPGLQLVVPGSLAPHAPSDMYAALGKNGQLLHVCPSSGLVVVRMGDAPTAASGPVALELSDEIWKRLNKIICTTTSVHAQPTALTQISLFPNPCRDQISIRGAATCDVVITDVLGKAVYAIANAHDTEQLNIADWKRGFTTLTSHTFQGIRTQPNYWFCKFERVINCADCSHHVIIFIR